MSKISAINKIQLFIISSLILTGCFNNNNPDDFMGVKMGELDKKQQKQFAENNCIQHRFAQGQDKNLFGIECIEGKSLLVETLRKGLPVSTSAASDEDSDTVGWTTEEEGLDFINEVYDVDYKILKNKGDDKNIPFLLDFLPKDKDFYGALSTKYEIVFKTVGNYLVLFKASENLEDIPHNERTSISQEGDRYMVPFIGYPIEYCEADPIRNTQDEETYQHTPLCDTRLDGQKYLQVKNMNPQAYIYRNIKEKRDLFPSEYFNGNWFFTLGAVESRILGEVSPFSASLVKMRKTSNSLDLIDASGSIQELNRQKLFELPVAWKDFEMSKNGDIFEKFNERENEDSQEIRRPYLKVNFETLIGESGQITKVLVTNDYFSITFIRPEAVKENGQINTYNVKYRLSFLREKAVDTKGFIPRRLFEDDHDHVFGTLSTKPEIERKAGEFSEEELKRQERMIFFNTSLNSEEEKRTKTKTIQWHFSTNSTRETEYRDLARKAVRMYNRAFEIIMKGSDKQVKVELIEDEEKDLGDLRYNLINLVKSEDIATGRRLGAIGVAPSYSNANTGQIIGTTSNIFIHTVENAFHSNVRHYIRYELFQKNKRSDEENNTHVVSPYVKQNIKEKCPEVTAFIRQNQNKNLKPRDHLKDTDIYVSCGKKLAQAAIFGLILHEMGHSFGLGHNFKASIDKKNYYKDEEEIKRLFPNFPSLSNQIAQASSVMDYTPLNQPEMQYLGKYDLAALRFLYRGQVEIEDGNYISLNIPENPLNQTPLSVEIKNSKKKYLHCSDDVSFPEDYFCTQFDYGFTPLEITNNNISAIKRTLLSSRYRYDAVSAQPPVVVNIYFANILENYTKWMNLRNKYLSSNALEDKAIYRFNDPGTDYVNVLKAGLSQNNETNPTLYDLFYPVREVVPNFIMDYLFTQSMRCMVKDTNDEIHNLNLEDIKVVLKNIYHEELYVEDCYSEMITDFLEDNSLTLIEQTGVENFVSYYSEGEKADKIDVFPQMAHINSILFADPREAGPLLNLVSSNILNWVVEPDLLHKFQERFEKSFLKESIGTSSIEKVLKAKFYTAVRAGLSVNLTNEPDILQEHANHYKVIQYKTGTTENSFYRNVEEPMINGRSIEDIGHPFLNSAYKCYTEEESQEECREKAPEETFESYVIGLDETLDNTKAKSFIVPYENDNFLDKVIRKHNFERSKIDELNSKKDLSAIEQIQKRDIESYNDFLRLFIETSVPETQR